MKKRRAFVAGLALSVLLSYSCRMPHSVEIRTGNLGLSVPLGIEANLAELLRNNLSGGLGDMRVFDMVNHAGGAQAFLVAMEWDLLPSFNPGDYLDGIGEAGDTAIGADIVVPRIAWEATEARELFRMADLFATMEESLNTYSMPSFPPITAPAPIPLIPGMSRDLAIPGDMQNVSFFAFRDGNRAQANFDSVIVSGAGGGFVNTMELDLEILHPLPPGLTVTLTDIRMLGERSGRTMGSPGHPQSLVLDDSRRRNTAVVDISGETIELDDPPRFSFGAIRVEYSGAGSPSFDLNLSATIRVNRIALRGARGLRIGELRHPLPESIRDNIRMDTPTGFLNALIDRGTFAITAQTPPRVPGQTYGEGLRVGVELHVSQETIFLDGQPFDGLTGPWILDTETPMPVDGRTINGSRIDVDPDDSVLIVASGPQGISFELFDEHYANKTLPVSIMMDMDITGLSVVRWEPGGKLVSVPEIELDFRDMDGRDLTDFMERITFDRIGAVIAVSEMHPALDGKLAFAMESPPLGFPAAAAPSTLRLGRNDVAGTASESSPVRLDLVEDPVVPIVVRIAPAGGGYLEVGPLEIDGRRETRLALSAQVSLDFNWTEADINLAGLLDDEHGLGGGIPDEPINIREMLGDLMSDDFTFAAGSLDLAMFLDGPEYIVNKIDPWLTVTVDMDGEGGEVLFDGSVRIDGGFPILPDDTGVWEGQGLPAGGLSGVNSECFVGIFEIKPEAMSFVYGMELGQGGTITVEPHMFDDSDSGSISALIVMKIALEFYAYSGAYFRLPLADDLGDLFGRDMPGDPLFGDIGLNVNLLRLRLDFDDSIFKDARLHVDGGAGDPGIPDGDILFGREGLALNDGRSGRVEVRVTGNDLDLIERRLVPPRIRISYPRETLVRIPRNPLPTRFSVMVNGSLTLDLDD